MFILSDAEIEKIQTRLISRCRSEMNEMLDAGQALFESLYSEIRQLTTDAGEKVQTLPAKQHVQSAIHKRKRWIELVLADAVKVSLNPEADELPPDPVKLPPPMARKLVWYVLQVLAAGGDLSDGGLYFLSDVGNSLGMEPWILQNQIEQVQYDKRREFTQALLEYLDADQCYWVALMLWKAIHADKVVHPREYKYFENIGQLLQQDQTKLHQLEEDHRKLKNLPAPTFSEALFPHVYKYIVEIVMIDEEYDSAESEFVQLVGELFNYDKSRQDEIIQPVASALMLKKSLFAY